MEGKKKSHLQHRVAWSRFHRKWAAWTMAFSAAANHSSWPAAQDIWIPEALWRQQQPFASASAVQCETPWCHWRRREMPTIIPLAFPSHNCTTYSINSILKHFSLFLSLSLSLWPSFFHKTTKTFLQMPTSPFRIGFGCVLCYRE